MKKSEMFRKSIKDDKMRSRGLLIGLLCFLSALIIGLLLNYRTSFNNILFPFYIIVGIIIVTILIIIVIVKYPDYYKLTDDDYKIIANELDTKIEEEFPQYGIYITENYLVHISNSISTHSFAVPFKDILAISNYGRGGYVYSKKKRRNSILRILFSHIFYFDYSTTSRGKSVIVVTSKKRYHLGYYYRLNSKSGKDLEKITEYICNKNSKIDWV
ncbi:MAG: hypothetical protein ACI31S_02695 [Bacilli bacterium]